MAAGIYLLLMWGYTVLSNGLWFAIFLAMSLAASTVFWVSEGRAEALRASSHQRGNHPEQRLGIVELQRRIQAAKGELDLDASHSRLDALKHELTQQYAQFGQDQANMNQNVLGRWHRRQDSRGR